MSLIKWLLKRLRYPLIVVSSILIISVLILSFSLFTHSGNKLIINIVKHFESRFSLELVNGSLFDSPHFENIAWLDGETNISISSAYYQFDWSCLIDSVCLTTLKVNGISVLLPEPSNNPETEEEIDSPPLVIDIPIKFIVNNIDISDFNLLMGDLSVDLDNITLKADAFNSELVLSSQITGLLITLPDAKPEVTTKGPIVVNKTKKIQNLTFESIPAILTENMLPIVRLPINLDVKPLSIKHFKIIQNEEIIFELNHLQTEFSFKETQLNIIDFDLDIPETVLNLNGSINFIDDYPLTLNIDGNVKQIKQLEPSTLLGDLKYNINSNGSLSNLTSELTLSEGINLALSTHFNLFADNLPHSINLTWQDFSWPFVGEAQFSAKQGHFNSKGSLIDHQIELRSDYTVAELPAGNISLKTKGDLQHVQIESLKIQTLSGEIDFSGLLKWKDKINWLGQLQITNIDLASLETEYDGHFSGLIKQDVEITLFENSPPEWQFDFPELEIVGELLERPLTLNGRVSGDDKEGVFFENLAINNAGNSIIVDGLLADQNDFALKIDIVDLSQLLINADGDLKGTINVNGPTDKIIIKSQLSSQGLLYDTYEVGELNLTGQVILTEKPQLDLALNAINLNVENQLIDKLDIQIAKNIVKDDNVLHTIQLLLESELVSTDLKVFLTQTNEELLTQLTEATIKSPYQNLILSTPFDLLYHDENIDISPHCWLANSKEIENSGELCIQKLHIGESSVVVLDMKKIQLELVNEFLPEEFQIAGTLSADADINWKKDNNPNFIVNILSGDMLFKLHNEATANSFTEYPMEAFDINLKGDDDNIDIEAKLFADKLLDVSIIGKVQPYKDQPGINAKIISRLPDFSLFKPLIPMLEELKGKLNSEIALSGNLKKPEIDGVIEVKNAQISGTDLPMKITKLDAVIQVNNNSANLQASFDSSDTNTIVEKTAAIPLITNTINILDKSVKKISNTLVEHHESKTDKSEDPKKIGMAYIKGQLDWSNKLMGDVHIYANKLEVYDYGKFDLLLSPDIHLLVNEHVSIKGDLFIDKGKIVVKDLPAGAISESKDIIVIDVEKEEVASELPIILDLGVDMGDSFQLVAVGLDTFIEGNLLIKKQIEKDLTINGVLQLNDGSYRALGQQLVLQESRIVFQGSPEEPYLQIEAIRDSSKIEDDVTAGVRVTGTPEELELVIFSDPAMAQQEALSYLTRGKGLDGSSDGSTMANMLIDLAAGQSGGIMSTIGEEIGIKDLSLESSGSGDDQSVGIRGEIAPGVEVSYGVGVFDSFSILSLRYEILERLYIEASSGVYQAIDAYYEWDWD